MHGGMLLCKEWLWKQRQEKARERTKTQDEGLAGDWDGRGLYTAWGLKTSIELWAC